MSVELTPVEGGNATSAEGFSGGAVYAGLKSAGPGKLDLGLLFSDRPCVAAATFTQSTVVSPSVVLSRDMIQRGGQMRAVVVNSGIANACVGEQGMKDAKEMVSLAASRLGVSPEEVLVCSTGVIGTELPMGLVRDHMPDIQLTPDGGQALSRAIHTTDTRPKTKAVRVDIGGRTVTVGGMSKGAGMIHPNMATMLAFMTTDAAVDQDFLRRTLSHAVADSFNMIDIDTDTSTNDTCILLANGAAGNEPLRGGDADSEVFAAALKDVATHLAKEIARDGEGATKLIEVQVNGAHSVEDARRAARSVSSSPLVKTAVYGRDPNWGRILMAVGKTQIPLDESKIRVYINDIQIVEDGMAIPFHIGSVVKALNESEVYIRVDLNVGNGNAVAWACDLTEEYVVFNSAYTT
ncbi:MAG: bifunctional glutamate N-acetyltransferase/amino-acid acetyltransferase ArgJ [Chloroflexota bacterium]